MLARDLYTPHTWGSAFPRLRHQRSIHGWEAAAWKPQPPKEPQTLLRQSLLVQNKSYNLISHTNLTWVPKGGIWSSSSHWTQPYHPFLLSRLLASLPSPQHPPPAEHNRSVSVLQLRQGSKFCFQGVKTVSLAPQRPGLWKRAQLLRKEPVMGC